GSGAAPAGNADVDAIRHAVVSQVRAPLPCDDEGFDRYADAVHAHLFAGPKHERPDVALAEIVGTDRIRHRLDQLIHGIAERHPIDLARVVEAAHVLTGPEDRAARRRLVTPHAFENARAVVGDMAHHVNGGVLPVHELSIAPDLVRAAVERLCHVRDPLKGELESNGARQATLTPPRTQPFARAHSAMRAAVALTRCVSPASARTRVPSRTSSCPATVTSDAAVPGRPKTTAASGSCTGRTCSAKGNATRSALLPTSSEPISPSRFNARA